MKRFLRRHGVQLIRYVLQRMQLVLTTRIDYEQLQSQRDNAVRELLEADDCELVPGMVCVVFSKDRVMQLHALLASYMKLVKNPVKVHVLYKPSDAAHEKAYNELIEIFRHRTDLVTFERENIDFKTCLTHLLDRLRIRSVMFLVDDIVFIREVDFSKISLIDPASKILSLRLSPSLKRSYTADMPQSPPEFEKSKLSSELLEFDWFKQGNEWSYPWSVDGHIFSLAEIRVISRISSFVGPNSYENCLKSFNDIVVNRKGMCFNQSVILNLPINRVQTEIDNISGEVSTDMLLEYWNRGLILDTFGLENHTPAAPHEDHILSFTMRDECIEK